MTLKRAMEVFGGSVDDWVQRDQAMIHKDARIGENVKITGRAIIRSGTINNCRITGDSCISNCVINGGNFKNVWIQGGLFEFGLFISGHFFGGTFLNGLYKGGRFQGGTFYNGVFKDGMFYDGKFKNGMYCGGMFMGGQYHAGAYHAGTYYGGTFLSGVWRGGTFYGGTFTRDPILIIDKDVCYTVGAPGMIAVNSICKPYAEWPKPRSHAMKTVRDWLKNNPDVVY